MCFSQSHSASFALLGLLSLYKFKDNKKIKDNLLTIPLIFYIIMEILQTVQYSFVNQCDNPINIYLTEFAYLLILIQPIMWNLICLKKKNKLRTKFHEGILYCAIILCIVWIIGHVIRRFKFWGNLPTDKIEEQEGNQAQNVCTHKNPREHLYWTINFRNRIGVNANWFMYFSIWFIPILLIPGEFFTFLILISGLIFSYIYVKYKNQSIHIISSLWCLMSAPMLLLLLTHYGFND